jgi:paraquat-inducible protein B
MDGFETNSSGNIKRRRILRGWQEYAHSLEVPLEQMEAVLQQVRGELANSRERAENLSQYIQGHEQILADTRKKNYAQGIRTVAVHALYEVLREEINAGAEPNIFTTYNIEKRDRYVQEQIDQFR